MRTFHLFRADLEARQLVLVGLEKLEAGEISRIEFEQLYMRLQGLRVTTSGRPEMLQPLVRAFFEKGWGNFKQFYALPLLSRPGECANWSHNVDDGGVPPPDLLMTWEMVESLLTGLALGRACERFAREAHELMQRLAFELRDEQVKTIWQAPLEILERRLYML